jgi:L-amino acid N-acyltransferase YncA
MDDKIEILKDGTRITLRDLRAEDLEALMEFYNALSSDDRRYLKVDVTRREVVKERIRKAERGDAHRIVAVADRRIVADGGLEVSSEEWGRHQGEIRVIVADDYRKRGLAILMVRELYSSAMAQKVDLIVAKMLKPQKGAEKILRKLGFRKGAVIPNSFRDLSGEPQDLIVWTCDVQALWKELEHLYSDSDWQRCR